ncbi:MAG: hypothetical protein OEW35_04650 [Gammaproteobacteria bacterium]|nr:hypothetical protein [Gammaproteobacteria bacterium]MDH4254484.1 hypothetical protein [Gammaproteobacteria bacterium]MDH5309088.1 hypothetical protein [Gammaproteobacteria bacterium]
MKVIGIRFCYVSPEAARLSRFLADGLGLPQNVPEAAGEPFAGGIFPAGDSWVEIWPESPGMPTGAMLQVVVDDADAWADRARSNGLDPAGPIEQHGERIYFLEAPGGLSVSFLSRRPTAPRSALN